MMKRLKLAKTSEELRKLLELRRSNAASYVPNKKHYIRKSKHRRKLDD